MLGALAVSALTTGAMGAVTSMPAFLLLRAVGGAASAFVLVLASALVLGRLAAVGRPEGVYTLGRNRVIVRGDVCVLEDGVTIASSMLTMNRAVANARRFAGVPLTDAVRMATLVPAQVCGCASRKGSIETGKDADLALLRPDFSVEATILDGEVVYRADAAGSAA